MSVYPDIASFANETMAVYVGASSLSTLALRSMRNSLGETVGKPYQLAVSPYGAELVTATLPASGNSATTIAAALEGRGRDVVLRTSDRIDLKFTFGIAKGGAITDILSEIIIHLNAITFELLVQNGELICLPGETKVVPVLSRSPDFDDIIKRHSLDAVEATRIEGMLLYSGLQSAIAKCFADTHKIDLIRLFPGVVMTGPLDIAISSDQQSLFIKSGQGLVRSPDSSCECADVGNGIGAVKPGTGTPTPNADPAGPVGEITLGGPQAVNIADVDLGRRRKGEGPNGIFIPTRAMSASVDGPFPAVRFDVRDNGFIGWKAAAIIDFSNFVFTPDPGMGRFYVDLDFRAEVYGSVHVDLGKLGKIRVTEFSAEQAGPGANKIRIGAYLVIGSSGVFIKPVLEEVNIGKFEVNLRIGTIVGTPFGGWGMVIGFIFDKILGAVIAAQIPWRIDAALREYMGRMMWKLLDASYSSEIAGVWSPHARLEARYDGGAKGFLISSEVDRG